MTDITDTTDNFAAPPYGPIVAIKICLHKWFDFSGRASRSEYWWFWLFVMICEFALFDTFDLFDPLDFLLGGTALVEPVGVIIALLFSWLGLAVSVRRLHDLNHSAWHLLFIYSPLIVPLMAIALLPLDWLGETVVEYSPNSGYLLDSEYTDKILGFVFVGWGLFCFVWWICWFTCKGSPYHNKYNKTP